MPGRKTLGSALDQIDRLEKRLYTLERVAVKGDVGTTVAVNDEGTPQGNAGTFNFTGAGVTASVAGGTATVNVPGGGAGAAYDTIQEEGVGLTQRTRVNFVGGTVTASDDAPGTRTKVLLPDWGLVGDIVTQAFGDSPAAGGSGRTADAGHKHGMMVQAPPTITVVEIDLGTLLSSGTFDITGLSGLTIGKPVYIQQAPGPYTGKGDMADEAEMDQVLVTGNVLNSTTIRCYWVSQFLVSGNFKFGYFVGA